MNVSNILTSLMNTQIQKEFESAYIYLGFSAFFESQGLSGFAKWYLIQSREEQEHGLKIYEYLCSSNQPVEFFSIEAPKKTPNTIQQVLQQGLEHEEYITNCITEMYFQADQEKDLFAKNFLNWFINEQLEEEKNARNLIDRYTMFGATQEGLYLLDRELGRRK